MAKISNPYLFSTEFKIPKKKLQKSGIFDPVLNVDTNLFIDPLLLKKSKYKIISKDAYNEFRNHFTNLVKLLSKSKYRGDVAWRGTEKYFNIKEISGTCLGFGSSSISGRDINQKIKSNLIATAKEIIDIGITDPELFFLLPLLEDGIGPDSISDITTSIIKFQLIEFTKKILTMLGLKTKKLYLYGRKVDILQNPTRKKLLPVILLPNDILRDMPVASDWEGVKEAAAFNKKLRGDVSYIISEIWQRKAEEDKKKLKSELLKKQEYLKKVLEVFISGGVKAYDLNRDPNSIIAWEKILDQIAIDFPKAIKIEKPNNISLNLVVTTMIEQFRFLIEKRGINKLLWNDHLRPNKERNCQMLFFAVAISYCRANNIDINPEIDTGNGRIDFKFSVGYTRKIIVEMKMSYNPYIIDGFRKQLEMYKESEEASNGYYVIIDVGRLGKKLKRLRQIYNDDKDKLSKIIYVDGRLKETASKKK